MTLGLLRWALLLFAAVHSAAAAGKQILVRNLDSADGTPQALAADRKGHLFVVATPASQRATRVLKLDLNGTRVGFFDVALLNFPAVAVDDQGNVILSGNLDPPASGMIYKFDSQLERALFSKSLPAQIRAVAIGPSGKYLSDWTHVIAVLSDHARCIPDQTANDHVE